MDPPTRRLDLSKRSDQGAAPLLVNRFRHKAGVTTETRATSAKYETEQRGTTSETASQASTAFLTTARQYGEAVHRTTPGRARTAPRLTARRGLPAIPGTYRRAKLQVRPSGYSQADTKEGRRAPADGRGARRSRAGVGALPATRPLTRERARCAPIRPYRAPRRRRTGEPSSPGGERRRGEARGTRTLGV